MNSRQTKVVYDHVLPDIKSWPIVRLLQGRKAFVDEIVTSLMEDYKDLDPESLEETLSTTIYLELKRIKEEPFKVDPKNEYKYFKGLRKTLAENGNKPHSYDLNVALLNRLLHRYTEEIVGNFKIRTFKFARRALTQLFNRLLNSASTKLWGGLISNKHKIDDRIKILGPIEKIRSFCTKGTLIFVPTHFSNLDSILLGYSIDKMLGLPAFSYGAGLNLYEMELVGYFMNRLGAYKIDRRKKNPIYLRTLKKMSVLSIQKGVNMLFFPGGTRSRSGEIETELKLGLLSTILEAQRLNLEKEEGNRLYVVPVVIGYHSVLESSFLIEQHLKRTGQENYLGSRDQGNSYTKFFKFLWNLFATGSEVFLTFGEPMDVLGHKQSEDGHSIDKDGQRLHLKDYFLLDGEITGNKQREYVYTKFLAKQIVQSLHQNNTVLCSHLVSYVAFVMLKAEYPKDSIFHFLNRDFHKQFIPYNRFKSQLEAYRAELIQMEERGKLLLSDRVRMENMDVIIEKGIKYSGAYHNAKALKLKGDVVISEDIKLLYYYHNRLDHYDLDKRIEVSMLEKTK